MKSWLRKLLLNEWLLVRLGRWFSHAEAAAHSEETRKTLSRCQSVGQGVKVNGQVFVSHPESLVLGNNVHLGKDAYLFTLGGLTIGDHTHISRRLTVYTANHRSLGERLPYDERQEEKPVHIGRNVWIGMNVSIVPGVTIGDGAIIGMGTVVSSDVAPGAVVVGAGTRQIGTRDLEHYQRLVQSNSHAGVSGNERENADTPPPYRMTDDQSLSFFVASTGRAGSTTLARVLSQHEEITCLHEPRPQLIRLSTQFANSEISEEKTRGELKNLFETATIPQLVYGESDQKYFNLITPLSQILPNAKFIWLVRNGRDFVASAHSRGWFSDKDIAGHLYEEEPTGWRWSQFRLQGSSCGDMTDREWLSMTPFERCCWYWSYVNQTLSDQLDDLPPENWLLLQLEELESSCEKIHAFLGVSQSAWKIETWNAGRNQPPSWQSWDDEKKATFDHVCGELQSRLYPES